MGLILSVVNQKGGVGKTTTSVNVSTYLAKARKKVLLLDLDPQGNTTSGIGVDKNTVSKTIYDVIINNEDINECILPSGRKNLFVCPANIELAGAEVELVNLFSRETILKKAIKGLKEDFDFIIIDCPPSLGLLTINSLTACDGVIIPIQAEYYALEGLSQLLNTINKVKKHLNPDLDIFGVLVTMFDSRTQLSHQVAHEVKNYFGDLMFKSVIPRNVRLSEAPSHGKAISEYDRRSKGAGAYQYLAREIIQRVGRE